MEEKRDLSHDMLEMDSSFSKEKKASKPLKHDS